ncbi:MAG: GTP cyclohydrolase I FolE [Bryobacterales bacterium]|nr:GTP cyclohydrolase I FolE [Acidobacteriota bacterium]MCB9385829.1 GTP cyclohydrolase I FolE [Bryobacterales bacterium]
MDPRIAELEAHEKAEGDYNRRIEELTRGLLGEIGEDPSRDGLIKTPERVAKAWGDLTAGYGMSVDEVLNGALFDVAYDEMVIVKDIELFSLCEHHLLPFFGKAHVAYIPTNKVIGLSKTARLVDMFARRLQVQERLTREVADAIQDAIQPAGVGVIVEARHLCMMMRGVEKQHSSAITSTMLGEFRENPTTRKEFLSLVSRRENGV